MVDAFPSLTAPPLPFLSIETQLLLVTAVITNTIDDGHDGIHNKHELRRNLASGYVS